VNVRQEKGAAILTAIMAVALMAALGAGLALTTAAEATIAGNFRWRTEALYAAEAILEWGFAALEHQIDWNAVLDGSSSSGFTDGAPGGVRQLADGRPLDLSRTLSLLNCGRTTACTPTQMAAPTADRPWGANNPRWQLFAFGPLTRLAGGGVPSPFYAILLVADDPGETDGDPLRDGSPGSPGNGMLLVRGEAFGPGSSHSALEATVGRVPGDTTLRVISWRTAS
jgi:hypothetical protein